MWRGLGKQAGRHAFSKEEAVKVEWLIVAAITGWALTIVLYIISVIRGSAEKNKDRGDKLQIESLQKDVNHNHREVLLIIEALKDGQIRIKDDIKERKEVSAEKTNLIHMLSDRVTKLESRVDQLEEMREDLVEIKEMIKENARETRKMFEKNEDEIGKISIAMFNAGIK